MKTAMKYLGLVIAVMALTFKSCTKDGEIGPMGPAGQNGINGTNGEDGNANVRVFKYDISQSTGGSFTQEIPEITADVLENDLILGYIRTNIRENSPIPTTRARIGGFTDVDVAVNIEIGKYKFSLYRESSSTLLLLPKGSLEELKIIIAKSSNISAKSGEENMRSQLKNADVDINDYQAVMDYFGLDY
ncbi:MAG: hypothetical protein RH981_09695 [Arenibacter sp.]